MLARRALLIGLPVLAGALPAHVLAGTAVRERAHLLPRGMTSATATAGAKGSELLTGSSLPGEPTASGVLPRVLRSRELWATIDVCNAPNQPNTVGIRGSMPGDKRPHDRLWMSFHLQYLHTTTDTWSDLATGLVSSEYVLVGAGKTPGREDGTSFVIKPSQDKEAFTLRGQVDFQWRRAGTVLETVSEVTTAGHKSLAGADPPGYSAATCVIS